MSIDYEKYADTLYEAYVQSDKSDYAIERIKALYYGKVVDDHIHFFILLHDYLVKNGHDKNDPLWQGDADNCLWYEKTKDANFSKVIVDSRVVSCADDYTHIYVLDDYGPYNKAIGVEERWYRFRAMTAWPRQIPAKKLLGKGHKWGDHRDIKYPSIVTHRKHDFRFGYQDGRDAWYCFKYDSSFGTVEDAHWKESKMIWALRNLKDCWNEVEIMKEDGHF